MATLRYALLLAARSEWTRWQRCGLSRSCHLALLSTFCTWRWYWRWVVDTDPSVCVFAERPINAECRWLQYTDVDLVAESGYLKPVAKEFVVMPTTPNMMIELRGKTQSPLLNGIEIYSREVEAPIFGMHIHSVAHTCTMGNQAVVLLCICIGQVPCIAWGQRHAWTLPFVSVNNAVLAESNPLQLPAGGSDHDPITPDTAADTDANVVRKHGDDHANMTVAQTPNPQTTVLGPADSLDTNQTDQKAGHNKSQADSLDAVKDDESKAESPQTLSGSTPDPPSTDSPPTDAVSSKPDQSAELEEMLSPAAAMPEESASQPLGPAPPVSPPPTPAPSSSTRMVPVNFAVPAGTKACVASGKLQRIEGAINVDPPSVGFGEVAPNNWQSNAAALRLTNSGTTQQTITHISCSPLDTMKDSTIPYFVIQFGEGGNAPRVKYVVGQSNDVKRNH